MARIYRNVAVVIKDREQLAEGLRTTAGLLLDNHTASMFVLDLEIEANEKYIEDLEFLKEMDGMAFTNVAINAQSLGFDLLAEDEMVEKIRNSEIIIPF